MWRKNDALANRGLDAQFNGGAGGVASISLVNGGHAQFNTLPPVANANAAQPGIRVATIDLEADAAAAATVRSVALQGQMQDLAADAAGLIENVRLIDATGTYWVDGTCGEQGPALAITAAALVGGVAQFTAAGHGLANGDMVEISGRADGYNGKWNVFNVTANTFQVFGTVAPSGALGTARKTFDVVIDNADLNVDQPFSVTSWVITDPM